MARKPIMAGNWKMNLNHVQAIDLVNKLAMDLSDRRVGKSVEVVVIPPFTDLRSVQTVVIADRLKIKYGAQDVSMHESGAYTGEISAEMLHKLGCTFVIVGHSERRQYHRETDQVVNAKAWAAVNNDIIPIICVGEPLEVRQENRQVDYVLAQVEGSIAGFDAAQVADLVIAYEPVWAIGTGEVATPEDAEEVCGAIREFVKETHGRAAANSVRILYGGSVNARNAKALMEEPNVDGALIGGASLNPQEFAKIADYKKL